jgi:hypothetical protein
LATWFFVVRGDEKRAAKDAAGNGESDSDAVTGMEKSVVQRRQ